MSRPPAKARKSEEGKTAGAASPIVPDQASQEEALPPAWTGRMVDDFEIMDQIGAGAFSQVHLCQHKPTGSYAAVKIVNLEKRSEQELHTIVREISVFMNVSHPSIVSLYQMSTFENSLFFFMEYITKGTLLGLLGKKKMLKEDEARIYFVQMFDAIRHLHMFHFLVHRDLKLENVLLGEKGKVKIADFGLAGTAYNNIMHTFAGTCGYQAPEVYQSDYTEKADVWSLGVCLYAMLQGGLPFGAPSTLSQLLEAVRAHKWPSSLSAPALDLLKRLLTVSPEERPNLMQLQGHPWLKGLKQLTANIAPTPVLFYYMKTPSAEALAKYKRSGLAKPEAAIVAKCVAAGINEGKLKADLGSGEGSKETTTYFLLEKPLMTKPTLGDEPPATASASSPATPATPIAAEAVKPRGKSPLPERKPAAPPPRGGAGARGPGLQRRCDSNPALAPAAGRKGGKK